jgi:hypothetical protein
LAGLPLRSSFERHSRPPVVGTPPPAFAGNARECELGRPECRRDRCSDLGDLPRRVLASVTRIGVSETVARRSICPSAGHGHRSGVEGSKLFCPCRVDRAPARFFRRRNWVFSAIGVTRARDGATRHGGGEILLSRVSFAATILGR